MIALSHAEKTFGQEPRQLTALRGIGLDIGAGESTAVMSMFLAILAFGASAVGGAAQIKNDEAVDFYSTAAYFSTDIKRWIVPINGHIHELEADSWRRNLAVKALMQWLDLNPTDSKSALFRERARYFLADNERGKRVTIILAGQHFLLAKSSSNGHFDEQLVLPESPGLGEMPGLVSDPVSGIRWVSFKALTRRQDQRLFTGRVQFIEPQGLSVISDIDDTIKVSQVHDRQALLANTFLRPYKPVPGMAQLYHAWAHRGAAFHYVSSSPWQLWNPLDGFLQEFNFPFGDIHLRKFRVKDRSFFEVFKDSHEGKGIAIDRLFQRYPRRRFILVGDSGERDPEIYAERARRYPNRVVHIFIRDTLGEALQPSRFREAFKDIPASRWTVFSDPKSLRSWSWNPAAH